MSSNESRGTARQQTLEGALRGAAAAEAAHRALNGPTGDGPLHTALPGDGHDTASRDVVQAVCRIVGADIQPRDTNGAPQRVNVARCRSRLRRWAIRQARNT